MATAAVGGVRGRPGGLAGFPPAMRLRGGAVRVQRPVSAVGHRNRGAPLMRRIVGLLLVALILAALAAGCVTLPGPTKYLI